MFVALIALVAASAGVGHAAATALITGKQIKDASITGKDIKNKSVPVGKLSGKLPTGPAGATGAIGPAGPAGPAGLAGLAGPTGPAGPSDKAVALDVVSAGGSATWVGNSGALGGLRFADVANNDANFHFVLPANYTAGTPVAGTFTWHTAAISCGIDWQANYVSVSRAGQIHPVGGGATAGMSSPGASPNGSTPNLVQSASFTLTSPLGAFTLQPGDSYTFGLFRDGSSTADTCANVAFIDSMVIRYQ